PHVATRHHRDLVLHAYVRSGWVRRRALSGAVSARCALRGVAGVPRVSPALLHAQGMTQDLLIELGCEDLPARYVVPLTDALRDGIAGGLAARGISIGSARRFATPRRI